ncbi:hypothetical protein [Microseira wollei]|uniref:PatU n=1 Tax=Microseira wollei NIES-4236 TaxID=2530354 RepID=A0AAV3WQ50_9CYAN|nr:hypothetical protein [Microseira wollei]GET44304.1 hypothetical protein MiSe_91300 [Microseira wollei NIES-4236]
MNRDTEDFPERFLVWLLQKDKAPEPSCKRASGEGSRFLTFGESDEIQDWEIDEFDELESEILNATVASPGESAVYPQSQSGKDNFTLQDRFQALLKRRLQKELQDNPPLFPWETEISDAEPDYAEPESLPPNQFWTTHLQRLRLPVPIPPDIFAQLLECCQAVVQSSIASPIKLVRAVEGLFPGQSQILHQFASVVLASSSCDSLVVEQSQVPANFPSSYEAATPTEQMVLLLIAARQMIGSLTLTLSPHQPILEREWLTGVGELVLRAEYQVERRLFACLRVQGRFPCGGSLKLQVGQACAIASRPDAGQISVELSQLELNQTYPLEVLCPHLNQNPLIFGICPTS